MTSIRLRMSSLVLLASLAPLLTLGAPRYTVSNGEISNPLSYFTKVSLVERKDLSLRCDGSKTFFPVGSCKIKVVDYFGIIVFCTFVDFNFRDPKVVSGFQSWFESACARHRGVTYHP
ncbi:hypothetical protein IE53DRAFT_363099 [Violaceomyces palustris]|uniref:Uncharacterized protein n=1 Tax=Violaceomyces palustris TaxID=1673888 RepID=A0ACD0NUI6_9BASI|nr:hypothetical protein IE53DRAFT_363099 [Violaceomyces palustris]